MPKRFTDTEKWKKPWFRKLKPRWKAFWFYLCDNCDHAGIWVVDFELAEDHIGEPLDPVRATEIFGKQIHVFKNGERWFILDFIEYQYKKLRESKLHQSVTEILTRFHLLEIYQAHLNGLPNPCLTHSQPIGEGYKGVQDKDPGSRIQDPDPGRGGVGEEPASQLVAYLNEKTGKRFRNTEANLKPIRARLADGFTEADLKKVIDIKTQDWLHNPEMAQYLRPETLFRSSKFESYLNQASGETYGTPRQNPSQESRQQRSDRRLKELLGGHAGPTKNAFGGDGEAVHLGPQGDPLR